MEINRALDKFGLSEKESGVYLANLELGESTANNISVKSNIPRTLVYDILERLIEVGLVSYVIKNHKKYFSAADPEELLKILLEKQEAIKEVLPELESLQKLKGVKRPKVEVYEGKEGMKTVMNGILKSGIKEFSVYGSSRSSYEIIPYFIEHWHKERIKKKIKIKIIYNDTKETREKIKKFPKTLKLMDYRLMPITLESPTATMIYGNKIILQLWTKEPFAVLIENNQMADNYRKYFEELWKIAKK